MSGPTEGGFPGSAGGGGGFPRIISSSGPAGVFGGFSAVGSRTATCGRAGAPGELSRAESFRPPPPLLADFSPFPGDGEAGCLRHGAGPRPPRTVRRRFSRLVFVGLALCSIAAPAPAEVLVSNAGQTSSPGEAIGQDAQAFTTGTHSAGYLLTSIVLKGNFPGYGVGTVTLHSGSRTGMQVATFNASVGSNDDLVLTPTTTVTLSASTTYVIVAANDFNPRDSSTLWRFTSSDNEDASSATGWSIANDSEYYRESLFFTGWDMSTSSYQFTVNGTAVNNPPEFTATTLTRSIAENAAAGADVGAVIPAATDSDTLVYRMEGTDADSFTFDPSTRQIQTKAGVTYDHETKPSYTVIIKADDNRGGTDTVTVTITVTDVDEPPSAPAAPSVSATSGSTTRLDVTWSAPANTGPAITDYDLQYRAGASGAFTDGPQNVAGTSATIPDLAAGTSYQVQVRATNAEGDSDWSPVGTGNTNTPANNAPEFPATTLTRSLAEDTAANANVGGPIPVATDADGDPLTYSMEGADADSFTFDPSTRQIRTKAGVTYDFETKPSYTVIIKASDGTVSSVIAVTINLTATIPDDDMQAPTPEASPTALTGRKAWLARSGRTTAGHAAEAIGERLSAAPAMGAKLDLGGAATESALLAGALQALSGEAAPDARQVLANSSFVLPLAAGGAHGWTAWGRGAYTEFDGEEGELKLDGEVWTGTVGVDWKHGRWRLGLALSHSEGDGEVRADEGEQHDLESKSTGVHPYARWQMRDGLSAWGMLGWAEGELESRRNGTTSETDTEMRMAAFGLQGSLGTFQAAHGEFDLTLKSDVLAMRVEADEDAELSEVEADAQRVRVLLEGSGHCPLESGGTLWPTLEAGLRWDEGDAETGLGAEVGAGLRYADASGRLSAELTARGLLAHEENDYEEWGVGGSLVLAPDAAGRGLSLRLGSSFGAAGRETDGLWSPPDLAGRASEEEPVSGGRFEAELGYGLNGPAGRGTLTSHVGYERDGSATRWRLGTRLEIGEDLQLRLEGVHGDEPSLGMQGALRW